MSKKDYIAIAAALRGAKDMIDVRINIATYLASENPRFDAHKFITAALPPVAPF